MANQPLQVIKAVSALPTPLAPNTFYLVRVNQGYDLYATDTTGSSAYKINVSPNQLTDVIAVEQGGTGAKDAETARANLGVLSSNDVLDYILGYKDVSFDYIINKLFNNSEQGFAFDFNDLSTMYQDEAGTIPVTGVGQPVGRVLDKSGRGNHATQPTSAKRPILQQNATTGAYYLAFDGVDDYLVTSNINFNGQNNLSLFTSVVFNNLSSTSQGIAELSTASWLEQGTFLLIRGYGGVNAYALRRNFSTDVKFDDLVSQSNTDTKAVLTGIINSTTSEEYMRNFGTLIGSKTLTVSSETFKNYPLYIGVGEVPNYPLNGNLYSLIGVARIASTTEITNIEKVIARNIGVDV